MTVIDKGSLHLYVSPKAFSFYFPPAPSPIEEGGVGEQMGTHMATRQGQPTTITVLLNQDAAVQIIAHLQWDSMCPTM